MLWNEYGQIVNTANSLRKYYHLPVFHETDKTVDEWLQKHHFRCVIALLIDAMGTSVLNQYLTKKDFFIRYSAENITTVFPPTTTAATTSFRTGKYPVENGWLGWNQYFREKDDNIVLFMNHSQYGNASYPGYSYQALPVSFITDELNIRGTKSTTVWPAWREETNTFSGFLLRTKEALSKENQFIYAYWDAFDTLLHHYGPSSEEAHHELLHIQEQTRQFALSLPEYCGLLIIADHSQIDVKPEIMDDSFSVYFRHLPALEPRTVAFYIHADKQKEFQEKFLESYGNDFDLYTHEEVIDQHIFGKGIPETRFEEFIGDYLAVAKSDVQLLYRRRTSSKGDHAGGLKEEAIIPVILYPE